jgi:hypothetical protein
MEMTKLPTYTAYGQELEYEPSYKVTTLGWFHLAECARERMSDHCGNIHRWRGERRSFYSSVQNMNVDTKELLD